MARHIRSTPTPASPWDALLRLRWPLGTAIAVAFALGQLAETLVFGPATSQGRLVADVLGWGLLGGGAVWLSLTWASRQEQRREAAVAEALHEQQALNDQLQRANHQLALLSDVNRHIADSATLDEILSAALQFPQRLVPARAAVLVLHDGDQAWTARVDGANGDEIAQWRTAFGMEQRIVDDHQPRLIGAPDTLRGTVAACLVVPLYDGTTVLGQIELYTANEVPLPPDELALLQTIASEITEAIVSARRRAREERALYELERAIADERARIARDIQTALPNRWHSGACASICGWIGSTPTASAYVGS